ncbi:MAG: tetratricopeptide repeat protein [Methylocella sp.]
MRFGLDIPHPDEPGQMRVPQVEQLETLDHRDEFRGRELLQAAVTEAFALLNAGAGQEAIAQIKQYADLAARSNAGCYIFGLIYSNAGDLRHALTWFDRALALQPGFPEALSARTIVLQRLSQPQDALESFEAILKLRPRDAEALYSVGTVLQSLGRMTDALAAYEAALQWSPAHCGALMNRGALLERFGRLDEALACFDAIETIRPGDSPNLFNRGSVLQKLGRLEDALPAYEEAARRGPPDAETELNRGNVLQKLGRLEEALAAYDLASRYRDGYPQALYNKGIALQGLGRLRDALAAYDAALALDPAFYEASCNRGNILHELGQLEDALAAYAFTLKIRPGFSPALTNRANILLQMDRAEEAILSCNEVLRRAPEHAQCLGIRGAALHKLGRLGEALASLDKAVRCNPTAPDKWLNRGNVLQELDRHPEAVACYNEALRIKPHDPEALSGLGAALREAGRIDEALFFFDEALRHKPDYPDARNNRAGALLLTGSLKAGFKDFESRWNRSNAPSKTLISDLPIWEGQKLGGQAIVVWDEQGPGDLIQFSRYLLCLVDDGADVTLLCRKNMHRLLRSLPKPVRLVEALDSNESFACQSALMSLPCGFQTSLETIPAPIPYLHPEPGLVAKWAGRIGTAGFRIGVGWQDNELIDLQRSIPLACLAPLAAMEDVRLISLMKDQAAIEVKTPAGGRFTIESLGNDFDAGPDSFVDCAAAMESLDLVVTPDTAIAHLAGALGRPVFLALKRVPDWRWLMHREDCPWYPSMRLFRQAENGDWESVFKRIASIIAAGVTEKAGQLEPRTMAAIAIPGAVGELIDKIAILEIKESHTGEAAKRENIRRELTLLRKLKSECGLGGARLAELQAELKSMNGVLWNIESALRGHEAREDFGAAFVSLARQVYKTNDRRTALKKSIDLLFNCLIIEQKSYSS